MAGETSRALTSVVGSYSFVVAVTERVEYRRYVHVAEHAAAGRTETQTETK